MNILEHLKKYLTQELIVLSILLNIGGYYIVIFNNASEKDSLLVSDEAEKENIKDTNLITFEIKGAVNNPGVYQIENTKVINDAITLSGGLLDTAYSNNINLAKRVEDEMVIVIYTKKEYISSKDNNTVYIEKECVCPTYEISKCVEEKASYVIPNNIENASSNTKVIESKIPSSKESTVKEKDLINDPVKTEEESSLININTADAEKLMVLTGIGEAKAKKIIDYRNTNGLFNSIEDIKLVSGISENTFENIKNSITI